MFAGIGKEPTPRRSINRKRTLQTREKKVFAKQHQSNARQDSPPTYIRSGAEVVYRPGHRRLPLELQAPLAKELGLRWSGLLILGDSPT